MANSDYTENITTETIQRQALKVLYDGLNTEINSRQAAWTAADTAYFASIGRAAPGFTVETIESENFYPGTVPSLIDAPLERYPNVSCYAWQASPTNSRDDDGENYNVTLAVEVMVKSMDNELEVNSRIQKTLEAVHAVLLANNGLNRAVGRASINPPIKSMGDVFVRRAKHARGDRWFWQGGSLTYQIDKFVNLS